MCVCVCTYLCIYIYVCVYIFTYICMHPNHTPSPPPLQPPLALVPRAHGVGPPRHGSGAQVLLTLLHIIYYISQRPRHR